MISLLLAVLTGCKTTTTIAFDSNRTGTDQVFLMDADGTNLRQLTSGPTYHFQAALSPLALKIAYIHSTTADWKAARLFTVLGDGTSPTQINTIDSRGCRWSPKGADIAFSASTDDSAPDIYLIRNDGVNLRRLTTDPGNDIEPSFDSQGDRIVFTSTRNGASDIYVMNVDGTNQTRLTSDPAPDAQPSFSPDGTEIAFWSRRSGNGDIFLMNADGSNVVNVTSSETFEFEPVFSPDGNEIAFSSTRDGNSEIYVINLNTKAVRRLTNDPAHDGAPDWKK